MSDYKINSFGMSMFRGVNHGEKPDDSSILLTKLKTESFILSLSNPIDIEVRYVNTVGDVSKVTFDKVVSMKWWPGIEFCEIEYRSGRDYVTMEILKSDVIAINEIVKTTPLTGKSRKVKWDD